MLDASVSGLELGRLKKRGTCEEADEKRAILACWCQGGGGDI